MSKLKKHKLKIVLSIVCFVLLFWLLFSKAKQTYNPYLPGDYHSSLFADPSGYNVYLPGIFDGWFNNKMPKGADSICGYGFTLNTEGKIISKYPYGVALLQSPFYLGSKVFANYSNQEFNAYNELSQITIDIAGISYGVIGLILLFFFLQKRTNNFAAVLTIVTLLLGTNVYYYLVKCPGYSHIYSFFLFVCLLHASSAFFSKQNVWRFALLISIASIIILVRPLNIIVLPIVLFIDIKNFSEVISRLKQFFNFKNILIASSVFLIFFLPQIIYWKWAFGSFTPDTYGEEGFSNALKPRVLPFLFSPWNGLLPYSPVYALLLITMGINLVINRYLGIAIIIIIITLIYLSTAWYTYAMGCGFGARNFVEYSVLLSIPFAYFVFKYVSKLLLKILLIGILIIPTLINQKLTETFDMCFFGKGEWDWKAYNYLLFQKLTEIEIKDNKSEYLIKEDFISDPLDNKNVVINSGEKMYVGSIELPLNELNRVTPVMCNVKVDLYNLKPNTNCELAIQILRDNKQIFYSSAQTNNSNKGWYQIYHEAYFPSDLNINDKIVVFIINHNSKFLMDNYFIRVR